MKKMKVEDKLALNIFHVDEENSHIEIDKNFTDEKEIQNFFWHVLQNVINILTENLLSVILDVWNAERAEFFLTGKL